MIVDPPAEIPRAVAIGGRSDRTCGDCRLCCKVLSINEVRNAPGPVHVQRDDGRHVFRKEAGQWCRFCAAGKDGGCTVYADRPESCATYACAWLQGVGEEDDRPDKLKVVIQVEQTDQLGVLVIFFESYPGVIQKSKRAQQLFTALYNSKAVDGCAVVPSPTLPRRLIHKRRGVSEAVPLVEQFKGDDLIVDADARTVGGEPFEEADTDAISRETTDGGS